ncbi:MAG: hypothetical protein EZS28_010806 [Streblomastix strix]|uniref:Uncharacterized protein n=1 Tax=Streblomastix strix TaxID=222440 RepID=A0A5J4WG99_9EUKA|nr:MAG: hypothetical protein EZS28_010806 [Streblomastix strix]
MKKEDVNDDILHSNNRSPDHTTEDILTLSVVVTPPSSPNIQRNNASDLFVSQTEQQTELDSRRSVQQFSTPIPSFFIPIINQSQIIPQQLEQVNNSKQQEQQLISDGAFNVQMIDQIPIGQALALFLNGYQQCDEDEQKLILSHIRMDIEDYEQKERNEEQMLYQALCVDDDAQLDKDNQITDSSNIQQPIVQNQRIRMHDELFDDQNKYNNMQQDENEDFKSIDINRLINFSDLIEEDDEEESEEYTDKEQRGIDIDKKMPLFTYQ